MTFDLKSFAAMPAFDTVFPADSLEFCPSPKSSDIFVCGTYKLDENQAVVVEDDDGTANPTCSPQHRRGQCLVFQVDSKGADGSLLYHQIHSFDLPAILDMKWCHRDASSIPILGIADSEGKVTLHEWQDNKRALKQCDSIQCASSDVLCLSMDWSNRRTVGTDLGNLVVSLSNGFLCILRPSEGGLSLTDSWHAHDHEPWIAAWNYWDTNAIYSGGDDLKLKGWDIRQGFERPTFTNKRFDAGVTSIQSHPHVEHLIAVGSYNNMVQLFDVRKPLVSLAQANAGGGAWRVKWHPSAIRKQDLLVACMHDGFKVVHFDLDNPGETGTVVKRFDRHESLAYGVDWSFSPASEDNQTIVGSCSFYDHSLNLWAA